MMCRYEFTIEWYSILSKACLMCPFNLTHCYNKDCISGNGVIRSVLVANRMLPGPQIYVCKGDTIYVNVFNNMHLSDAISLHW